MNEILQSSANDLADKLINKAPAGLSDSLSNIKSGTLNSMKYFRDQRNLNTKINKQDGQPLNQVKKTKWQKFKRGFGNVWRNIGAGVKSAVNFIPIAGPAINAGINGIEGIVKSFRKPK